MSVFRQPVQTTLGVSDTLPRSLHRPLQHTGATCPPAKAATNTPLRGYWTTRFFYLMDLSINKKFYKDVVDLCSNLNRGIGH